MKRKTKIILASVCAVILFAISFILGKKDYNKVKQGYEPSYSSPGPMLRDGGTVKYTGLGYTITVFNKIEETIKLNDLGDREYKYKQGTKITFWLPPFLGEEDTYLVTSKTIKNGKVELKKSTEQTTALD